MGLNTTFGAAAVGYNAVNPVVHNYSAQTGNKPGNDILSDLGGALGLGTTDPAISSEHDNLFQRVMNTIMPSQEEKTSLMGLLQPGKEYSDVKVSIQGLKRDPGQAITDGAKVQDITQQSLADVREGMAEFKADFKEARGQAVEAMREACDAQNVDFKMAYHDLCRDEESNSVSSASALGSAFAQAHLGMLFGAMSGAHTMKQDIGNDKKLTVQEKQAILNDMLVRLQTPPQEDSRIGKDTVFAPAGEGEKPKQEGKFQWVNLDVKRLEDLLKADPEGRDQPEFEKMHDMHQALMGVEQNLAYAEEHYGDNITVSKLQAAGNIGVLADVRMEADTVAEARAQSTLDAGSVGLAGADLAGYERFRMQFITPLLSPTVDDRKVAVNNLTPDLGRKMTELAFG